MSNDLRNLETLQNSEIDHCAKLVIFDISIRFPFFWTRFSLLSFMEVLKLYSPSPVPVSMRLLIPRLHNG